MRPGRLGIALDLRFRVARIRRRRLAGLVGLIGLIWRFRSRRLALCKALLLFAPLGLFALLLQESIVRCSHGPSFVSLQKFAVNVAVTRYKFGRVKRAPRDAGTKRGVWVLEGTLERREVLPKVDAARHTKYSRFFNKLGNVNQWSVLRDA